MALFVNPGKDWEKNMSEEDIAQMESQGYDVTELRAKRAKANTALWMPGNNDYYPAVFVFALDQKHIHDTEWLKQIAEEINVLQDADQIPGDCRKLIQTLRDDTSEFCFRIGKSVCGDANAWCATYKFDKQTALPRKALPSDGIVPFLLKSAPVENQFVDFKLIPTEFYIG